MKVVIFAGGFGTRISEESHLKPKPMIEIGGRPIIWHIMKIYEQYGVDEFIVCLGYKGYMIKEYFLNYYLHNSDVTINLADNDMNIHRSSRENFKVTLVDTGLHTKTAGRLKRVQKYVGDETFMLTYGDGVADVDITGLLKFHKSHGHIGTVTSVQPAGKFGALSIENDEMVSEFVEKPAGGGVWINGGFFVLEPEVFKYLDGPMDNVMWEDSPLEDLTADGHLYSFKHRGFWKCMDALRDKQELEKLWQSGNPVWKNWE